MEEEMEQVIVTIVLLAALYISGVFRIPGRTVVTPKAGERKRPVAGALIKPALQRRPPVVGVRGSTKAQVRPRPVAGGEKIAQGNQIRQLAARLSRVEAAIQAGEVVVDSTPEARNSLDTRHYIQLLSRKGETVHGIARQLKLSRSEVEVILKIATLSRRSDVVG